MRNLELPTPMSPCLRIFIEALLSEVDDNQGASWVLVAPLTPCAFQSDRKEGIHRRVAD